MRSDTKRWPHVREWSDRCTGTTPFGPIGSEEGQQHVENTDEAKQARKEAAALRLNDYDDLNVEEVRKKIQGLSKDDIESLLDYEKNHANRKTLVETLESRH